MPLPIEPGRVIADKYRVVREIGRGGMGVVVAADHLQLPQQVAIKLLDEGASATDARRFEREARIVVQLQSEHVCRVLDVGAVDGTPYIVMELLEGTDLGRLVAERGPLPATEVVSYLLQTCEALAEAHLLGVVHRDLKPSNLFLSKRLDTSTTVKVLDFGISKQIASGSREALTQTGSVLGSPRFMSPEQLKSTRDVDQRADVWSLGAVLHELLTAKAAFDADTIAELCVVILQDEPTPLRKLRPDLPVELEALVARCLEKDPAARFANVAELALALAPFAESQAAVTVPRVVGAFEVTGWKAPERAQETPTASVAPRDEQGSAGGTALMPVFERLPAAPPASAPVAIATTATPEATGQRPDPYLTPVATPADSRRGGLHPDPGWVSPSGVEAAPSRGTGVAIALLMAVLGLAVLAGGAVLAWGWLNDNATVAADEETKPSHDDDDKTSSADGNAALDMYERAPQLIREALERHGGKGRFYAVYIYRSGFAKVELKDPTKPKRVTRYQYRGGAFERAMPAPLSDSDRAELPAKLYDASSFDSAAFARVRDDALRRAAGRENAVVFAIVLDKFMSKTVAFKVTVESDDGNMSFRYDGQGRFLRTP